MPLSTARNLFARMCISQGWLQDLTRNFLFVWPTCHQARPAWALLTNCPSAGTAESKALSARQNGAFRSSCWTLRQQSSKRPDPQRATTGESDLSTTTNPTSPSLRPAKCALLCFILRA